MSVEPTKANPSGDLPAFLAADLALIHQYHPRIANRVLQLWGSTELNPYLESVIYDKRGGREGFAEGIAKALFRINEANRKSSPSQKERDIWDAILGKLA